MVINKTIRKSRQAKMLSKSQIVKTKINQKIIQTKSILIRQKRLKNKIKKNNSDNHNNNKIAGKKNNKARKRSKNSKSKRKNNSKNNNNNLIKKRMKRNP